MVEAPPPPMAAVVIACLVSALMPTTASAAPLTSGTPLVLGLGPALVGVLVLGLFCLLICIFGYSTEHRRLLFGGVVATVGITCLFFFTVTIRDVNANTVLKANDTRYHNNMALTRAIVGAIMIGFAVIAAFSVLLMHVIKPLQGHFLGEAGRAADHERLF